MVQSTIELAGQGSDSGSKRFKREQLSEDPEQAPSAVKDEYDGEATFKPTNGRSQQ